MSARMRWLAACLAAVSSIDATALSRSLANELAAETSVATRAIVRFADDTRVSTGPGQLSINTSDPGRRNALSGFLRMAASRGFVATPLFSHSHEHLRKLRSHLRDQGHVLPDLTLYVAFEPGPHTQREDISSLVSTANRSTAVAIAYVDVPDDTDVPQGSTWLAAAGTTPLLTQYQHYLEASPTGIGARNTWNTPGGTGAGVKIVVYDNAFIPTHEDLPSVASHDGMNPVGKEHGTAAIGVLAAKHNGLGIDGIAHDAQVSLLRAAAGGESHADRLLQLTTLLSDGDVVLLEVGRKANGLGFDCTCNPTQANQVPLEFYPAEFDTISYLVASGISVIEATGNGCVDFDDPVFEGQFDGSHDSGAILVAAGSKARAPMCYTGFGSRVDLFALGEQVASLSYLREGEIPLFDAGPDRLYVPNFGGSSAAAAIVAGAVASLQGQRKAAGQIPLPPEIARDLLIDSGVEQASDPTRYIGRMPNLDNIAF